MSLPVYLAFVVATIVLVIIPGPTVTLTIANSLRHGRRAGLLNVAGTQIALALTVGIVLLGLASFSVLPLGAQQVTLPLARYEELRARANPDAVPAPAPPAPFAWISLPKLRLRMQSMRMNNRITLRLTKLRFPKRPPSSPALRCAKPLPRRRNSMPNRA